VVESEEEAFRLKSKYDESLEADCLLMGNSTHSTLGRWLIGPGGSHRLAPGLPDNIICRHRSLLIYPLR
jgi:hypothetical protein